MTDRRKGKTLRKQRAAEGWPLVQVVWTFGLAVVGYAFVGEVALAFRPHPWHWAAAAASAVVGYAIGGIWYRRRGDIV